MASNDKTGESMHQVIVNEENQFVVWPDARSIPTGWRHVGRTGTKSELTAYLREMFVETLPMPLLIRDGRQPETHWG